MSNETIINRTPETFGQKLERERLEAETVKVEYHVPLPPHVGETVVGIRTEASNAVAAVSVSQEPRTAEADRAGQVGKIEDPPVMDSVAADLLFAELVQRARVGHAPRDPDLREFREQVVAAFKHLGLDTAKFFGV
jgi:hypothetical protein